MFNSIKYTNMANNQNIPSKSEDIISSEFQTYDEGVEPGLDLSASEIEDVIKFMKEDLGITNPLASK